MIDRIVLLCLLAWLPTWSSWCGVGFILYLLLKCLSGVVKAPPSGKGKKTASAEE